MSNNTTYILITLVRSHCRTSITIPAHIERVHPRNTLAMPSFDQLSSLEAGNNSGRQQQPPQPPAPYADDPEFSRQAQELATKLFRLGSNISDLHSELNRRDTPRTRERTHNLLEETKAMFQSAGEGLRNLQTWEDVTPTQKYKQQKLSRQLKDSLEEFCLLQARALQKQKSQVADAKKAAAAAIEQQSAAGAGALNVRSEEAHSQLQLQQQQELSLAPQDEVEFQDALIREREEEIRNIEQGVSDLNVLFQQVAQIVNEQGEQIDTITDNVEVTLVATQGADYELRQAARYQKNARSKMCCLLIILAVILTIIVLAVVLA